MQIEPKQMNIPRFIIQKNIRRKFLSKRGAEQMLTKADEWGRGGNPNADIGTPDFG